MMTNPPPNPQPPRDERQDELIASVIAFGAIGAILVLGLGRVGTDQLFSARRLDKITDRLSETERLADAEGSLFGLGQTDNDRQTEGGLEDDISDDGIAGIFSSRFDSSAQQDAETEVRPEEQLSNAAIEPPRRRSEASGIVIAPVPIPGDDAPEISADAADEDVPQGLTALPPNAAENATDGEAISAGTSANGAESADAEFTDIPSDYWAAPFVNRLAEAGIISGFEDSTFRPDQPITRAEFAAQLAQAFPGQVPDDTINYGDVTSDYWAADAIAQVTSAEFMSGYPDGDFVPGESVSRLEVLVSLVSGLDITAPEAPQLLLSTYSDQGQIPTWAAPKVAAATEDNLVINYPNPDALNPLQPSTRAETAAMIYQALVQQGKFEPISSDYVVQPE